MPGPELGTLYVYNPHHKPVRGGVVVPLYRKGSWIKPFNIWHSSATVSSRGSIQPHIYMWLQSLLSSLASLQEAYRILPKTGPEVEIAPKPLGIFVDVKEVVMLRPLEGDTRGARLFFHKFIFWRRNPKISFYASARG